MAGLLLRAGFFLVRRLPKRLWVGIIAVLAFIASWLPSKELSKIIANYQRMSRRDHDGDGLSFAGLSARAFARQVFFHQGLMVVETLRYSFDPAEVTIDGLSRYRQELASGLAPGGGVIIATGHIGSWELVGAATAKAQNKPFAALAKAPSHPDLLAALNDFRHRLGITSLWNRDAALLKKMLGTLRAGDALGMVIDQKPKGRKGYPVEFFGEPIAMVGGPIKMSQKTASPIYGVYCLRVKPFHYALSWERLYDPDAATTDQQLAQTLADSMARAIVKAPSQWAWNYKRWSAASKEPSV